jgi:hypothetical protein
VPLGDFVGLKLFKYTPDEIKLERTLASLPLAHIEPMLVVRL